MTDARSPLDELARLDREHLMHPITELRVHEQKGPRVVVGGKGIRLELAGGRSAIDGFSGLFNINVGHGRTEIADAVAEQMRRLAYYPSFWDFSSEPAIRLGERLARLLPAAAELDHFLFTTGGSDANETNFRIARLYHAVRGERSRTKILSRSWAYHGITRAAGSATTLPAYRIFAEPDPLHVAASTPYCFRCEFGKTHPGCGLACAEDVEAAIRREGPETVAAVIAEPVLGTGGIVPPPPDYFPRLAEICRAHGVLLILDEVITGFGRTGRWFGMEHWDLRPDLVSFAKGVTSGYLPLGGVAVRRGVYETLRDRSPKGLPFMVGLTYNNHPASCAAALANLDIVEREGLVENARETGAYLLACLREELGGHPLVADVRGLGMLAAVECAEPGTRDPVGGRPMSFPAAVAARCWERGLIVRAMWENVALAPPLVTTRSDVDEIVAIVAGSLRDAAGAGPARA
jgi:adenosylmethionine-8-amino-7-oxononanoate aminotransferase